MILLNASMFAAAWNIALAGCRRRQPKRQKFKRYPIGFFHIDIAEVRTEEGKLYLFVAIDRTSRFAVAGLVEKANRKTAWEFLELLLKAVPCKILTDNVLCWEDLTA